MTDDDGGVDPLAEERRRGAGDEEDDHERIGEEEQDLNEPGGARRPRGLVRANVIKPPARVVGRQAAARYMHLREERLDGIVRKRVTPRAIDPA